jgi:hypothetical protein
VSAHMKLNVEKGYTKNLTTCKVLINSEHTKNGKLEKREIRGFSKLHNTAIKNGDLSLCRVCSLLE